MQDSVVVWRLQAEYAARGGILADSIGALPQSLVQVYHPDATGFGKTAVALALVDVAPSFTTQVHIECSQMPHQLIALWSSCQNPCTHHAI